MSLNPWTYVRARRADPHGCDAIALRLIADVAERHGLTPAQIEGRCQKANVTAARYEAMARVYATGLYGTVDVGSFFDCRDHSTVLRGIRRYRERGPGRDW